MVDVTAPRAAVSDRSGIALLRDFVRFARWRGARALLLMLAGGLTEGLGLALIVPLVGLLAGRGGGAWQDRIDAVFAAIGISDPRRQLALLLTVFVVAVTLRALVLAVRDRQLLELQQEFVDDQRVGLVRALSAARWQDISGLRHARITFALTAEIPRLSNALHILLSVVTSGVMLAAQAAVVCALAPVIGVAAVAVLLVTFVAARPSFRRAHVLGAVLKHGNFSIADLAAQLLGGLKMAIAHNIQAAFAREFEETVRDLGAAQRDYNRRNVRARVIATVAAAVSLAAAVLIGTSLALPGATLIAVLATVTRMVAPGTAIVTSLQILAGVLPSYADFRTLRDDLGSPSVPQKASAGVPATGAITFDDVGFAHPGGGGCHGLNLRIDEGRNIGIVGVSGAGKTTFLDLLCGLLVPDRGVIRIGGEPLAGAALDAWRDRIAYIPQDSYMFNGTIRRNLGWGVGKVEETDMYAALAMVSASDIVGRIPGGLDAELGERGTRLSGGERQRLSLARALIRRPAVLILDEATNAIDIATERAILDRLTATEPRMTLIVVTHRPETLRFCDRVLRFDEGRIIADGNIPASERHAAGATA